jgi:hypothetical protein
MRERSITIALEGDVSLETFSHVLTHLKYLLVGLSNDLDEPAADWVVESLQHGSAVATFKATGQQPIELVIEAFANIGERLATNQSLDFYPTAKGAAHKLIAIDDPRVDAVRFETMRGSSVVRTCLSEPKASNYREALGQVTGRVQALNNRGRLRFTLYDLLDDRAISCWVDPEREEQLKDIWGKVVTVEGLITRDGESGRPISVKQVARIQELAEATPNPSESLFAARGILTQVVDSLPEVAIRRMRDGG